jgi:hypothetical protein
VVGGMVLLAVGGAAYGAVKLSQKDAQRIEDHTGASVEELTEEELVQAMRDLGIQSIELTDEDKSIVASEPGQGVPAGGPQPGVSAPAEEEPSYLDELERLAGLRDKGILTEEEFQAKKAQLLGL